MQTRLYASHWFQFLIGWQKLCVDCILQAGSTMAQSGIKNVAVILGSRCAFCVKNKQETALAERLSYTLVIESWILANSCTHALGQHQLIGLVLDDMQCKTCKIHRYQSGIRSKHCSRILTIVAPAVSGNLEISCCSIPNLKPDYNWEAQYRYKSILDLRHWGSLLV